MEAASLHNTGARRHVTSTGHTSIPSPRHLAHHTLLSKHKLPPTPTICQSNSPIEPLMMLAAAPIGLFKTGTSVATIGASIGVISGGVSSVVLAD